MRPKMGTGSPADLHQLLGERGQVGERAATEGDEAASADVLHPIEVAPLAGECVDLREYRQRGVDPHRAEVILRLPSEDLAAGGGVRAC